MPEYYVQESDVGSRGQRRHRHSRRDGPGDYQRHDYGYASYDPYADPRYSVDALTDKGDRRGRSRSRRRSSRGRSLSRGAQLAAAAGGAGLALGAQQVWDRRSGSKGRARSRSRVGQAALGVAGAVAGDLAAKQWSKTREAKREKEEGYSYVGGSEYDDQPPKRSKSRRKSIQDAVTAGVGALGLKEMMSGGGRDHRDDRRSRRGSSSDSYHRGDRRDRRSRSLSRDPERLQQAAKAAATAAFAEAWRSRKEPGGVFSVEKGRRILTAAAGAGGIDALADKNPDKHGGRNAATGAIGGLLLNRFVNGPRDEIRRERRERQSRSRSRGRSSSRGGNVLKDLGVAGIAAAAGKKFLDSRKKSKERRHSSSSGSYSPPPRNRRSRSIDGGVTARGDPRAAGGGSRRAVAAYDGDVAARPRGQRRGSSSSSSSSDFSLDGEEKNRKKMRAPDLSGPTYSDGNPYAAEGASRRRNH